MGGCAAGGSCRRRAARLLSAVGMDHHKRSGYATRDEVVGHGWTFTWRGEEENEVGMAQALAGPCRVRCPASHDEDVRGGLLLAEPEGDALSDLGIGPTSRRGVVGADQQRPCPVGDFAMQVAREGGGIDTGSGGVKGEANLLLERRGGQVRTLQTLHLDLGHAHDGFRRQPGQFDEPGAVQSGENTVAHGLHRGGADAAGQQGHFADGFAPADLADDTFLIVRQAGGAEPAAEDDIHGVGRFTLAAENFTGCELQPADARGDCGPCGGIHAAELLLQHLAQERLAGFESLRSL